MKFIINILFYKTLIIKENKITNSTLKIRNIKKN